ncbi:cytochrome P450 4d8-like [Stomoxys calcitrans]|uniref:cytochrome P450 4d8-like n=1 Tax=Stomoxys calcitrans TaxID=35570 RepID=UPI0027E323E7|nr:cytochrome P450 4d8-like [Stomoxys calcitrans]
MYLIIVSLIAVLFIVGYHIDSYTKHLRKACKHIPGPFSIPVLGCVGEALTITPKKFLKRTFENNIKYGTLHKAWSLNHFCVFSSNAEFNEQLLASSRTITKDKLYDMLKPWLGTGLLISSGDKWHARRKIITPTFHFTILEKFLEIFEQQSTILVENLSAKADGKTPFNMAPYISAATLDIIAETAMGVKVNAQIDKNVPYSSAVEEIIKLMTWRFLNIHLHSDLVFSILHPFKKLRQTKIIKLMHNFTRGVIENRRKTLENSFSGQVSVASESEVDDVGSKKHKALFDVLLQSSIEGQPLTDEDIREEVDTFMFEGHETTSTALGFTLHLLAQHPKVQQKVVDELNQIYGENNPLDFTLRNLNELKYMEHVIKESMRLYPPVPLIGREITEDFKYTHSSVGNGVLPAGTQVIISIFNSMRESQLFENPSEFIPERHESTNTGSAYSFIPFSAGPRNCIGQKFAMYEMKVVISKIIRQYELLPLGPDVRPLLGIVMRSETGMHLGLQMRK